jgi:Flagellar hook-length control protein FliK
MAITVTPTLPVIAASPAAATPGLVLQPGAVVSAQVLNTLAENLVQIAIAGLTIDVLSEVPLQAGQHLQLAISQTEGGIRLAIVPPPSQGASGASLDSVTLTPNAPVAAPAGPSATPPSAVNPLTPLERAAVAVATETAVTQQGSQAPLFANLGAVAASNSLPPPLQQAVLQVLAQRTSLDPNLGGGDIQTAFQKSGLFLEASLASGSVSPASGIPDLKAALIVLRQTLVTSLGATASPAGATAATPQPAVPGAPAAAAGEAAVGEAVSAPTPTAPPLAPSSAPEIDVQEILLPQTRLPVVADEATIDAGRAGRIVLTEVLLATEPRSASAGAVLNLLQEALQEIPKAAGNASSATVTLQNGQSEEAIVRTNTPPPPFRGGLPSAQAIAAPSIAPGAPLAASAHHLLENTDAAIARQTLLQVASLPGGGDAGSNRVDPTAPRWSFEIPFATPQGTAMAQFEISRDGGGGNEVEAAKRIWRARFSLDVEPAGPVHALISLNAERTSVRMWAERPATAAQLRAGVSELSQALSQAELGPGDIVIRHGTPPQVKPARAGHFLDRAT